MNILKREFGVCEVPVLLYSTQNATDQLLLFFFLKKKKNPKPNSSPQTNKQDPSQNKTTTKNPTENFQHKKWQSDTGP